MEEKMSRLIITLTVIGIISALSLAVVYERTSPLIAEHEADKQKEAVENVLPEAEEIEKTEREGTTFFEGRDSNGSPAGVAVLLEGSGFQGMIEVMVGTDPSGEKIFGIEILQHEETPGLGARIEEEGYRDNYRDKPFGEYEVVKREAQDDYEVEAISGATVSSENVARIVEDAVEKIRKVYGGGV